MIGELQGEFETMCSMATGRQRLVKGWEDWRASLAACGRLLAAERKLLDGDCNSCKQWPKRCHLQSWFVVGAELQLVIDGTGVVSGGGVRIRVHMV